MIRTNSWRFLAILVSFGLAALPASADPPNLAETLTAQHELVLQEPNNPVALNDLGNLLVEAELYPEAETAYRRALDLSPENSRVRFNLALLFQQNDRHEEAEGELRTLLENNPDHAWGHYQLGVSLQARRQRAQALDQYARALALDPALSFAGNNPHIIENKLFSEALLLSQRYREQLSAKVPRQYSDPARIRNLMLGAKKKDGFGDASGDAAGDASATADDAAAGSGLGSDPDLGDSEDGAMSSSSANSQSSSSPSGGTAVGGSFVGGNDSAAAPQRRTQPSRSAGAFSGGSGSDSGSGGAASPGPRTREMQAPPKSESRGLRPVPPSAEQNRGGSARSGRYVPSRRSNASLDLRRIPESELGDVPTLFSDASGG